jgi:hypothetical protein
MGLTQAVGTRVEDYLKAGRVVEVLPETNTVERSVSVMYPNRQHLAPRVRVFLIGLSPCSYPWKGSGSGMPELYNLEWIAPGQTLCCAVYNFLDSPSLRL